MTESPKNSKIAGYISISEAARRIGVVHSRVYEYIAQGRLETLSIAGLTLVSEEAAEHFEPKTPTGRPRKNPRAWRKSPDNASFVIAVIRVRMRRGQQMQLMQKLEEMRSQSLHLFPGTMERYISEDDEEIGTIEIELVWKQNEMPRNEEYMKMAAAFGETFADVLDWSTAKYKTKTVLLHT